MNITVVGLGNEGCTISADLIRKGHSVCMLKTSQKTNDNYTHIKTNKKLHIEDPYVGAYDVQIDKITESYEEAIPGADVIIVCLQTNYHEDVIKKMSTYLKDGQTIIFEPGYLSTCYVLKHSDKALTIIEAESSPIDCRIVGPGSCMISFKNVLNPFGVYPLGDTDKARGILDALEYPYRFTDNVIEAALHNPNLIVHTTGALFSIPRIEKTQGEYWMYKEVFTPHVWNVCERLDSEKMNVMEATGVKNRQSYVEACQERNFVNDDRSPIDSFFDYAMNSSLKGPSIPDSRFLTEDIPQGLVMLESLGKALKVETPCATSLIDIASIALKRNFRDEGRTIETLGRDNIKKIIDDCKLRGE